MTLRQSKRFHAGRRTKIFLTGSVLCSPLGHGYLKHANGGPSSANRKIYVESADAHALPMSRLGHSLHICPFCA
jgi:hypothetical protein